MGESYQIDATTTVKRMESDMLHLMRERLQRYTEAILHLLNVELVIRGDGDVVEYQVPNTTLRVTFNSQNEGYGLKLTDGKDFLFASPSEMSLVDGRAQPLEEAMLSMGEADIRNALELLKSTLESLQTHVASKKEEFREKIDLINRYDV